ncbi:MAG TPA: GAF domain-containing protein [Kofleriaceae bacterium]
MLRRLDVRSYAVVPIRVRDTTIGSLSLFRTGAGRSYNQADVALLCDLADRAGLAIDNAPRSRMSDEWSFDVRTFRSAALENRS